MKFKATIQFRTDGQRRDAAEIGFREPEQGIRGGVWLSYDDDYYFDLDIIEQPDRSVRDRRAMSVRHPVDLEYRRLDRWPGELALDLGVPKAVVARAFDKGRTLRAIPAMTEVDPCPE
ncbi:hypothetical protein [Paracoccus sp. ME4]|uniref:hypothetical protein n=1 Tax=Paracoccus sp. ME4 TaxID=3138066 RepID=UPI00398A6153